MCVAVGVGVGVGVCVAVGVGVCVDVGVGLTVEVGLGSGVELLELLEQSVPAIVIVPVPTTPRILITAVVNTRPLLPNVTPVITVVVCGALADGVGGGKDGVGVGGGTEHGHSSSESYGPLTAFSAPQNNGSSVLRHI